MYYHKVLRMWVVDPVDYFILSAILGSIIASRLKEYLSEKKAMERLKNSIIKKSTVVIKSDRPPRNSKEMRMRKIYKVAFESRGGQFENFPADHQFSNEAFNLAQKIKILVERLAIFLKERELKGIAKIFFKNGRLLLDLILYKCRIDITYVLLNNPELSTQVIVITATAGGAAGFILAWFSAGASIVAPPLLTTIFLIRSITQQIINQKVYSEFKKLATKALEDEKLKETIRAVFVEGEVPKTPGIEMKPLDLDKNPLPQFDYDSKQTLDEFVKARMKEELGLVENPTPKQLEEIIHNREIRNKGNEILNNRKIRNKGKTVYFRDFIKEIAEDSDDIIDAEIIDAEIIKEAIKVKVRNQEL